MTRATNRRSPATAPPAEPASSDRAIEAALAGRTLSRRDGPLYRQVADILREAMEAGALRPGSTPL
jgi:hypothetical protein